MPTLKEIAIDHAEALIRIAELEAENAALTARFTAPIVCMCGSTRFKQSWIAENARLTCDGNIILSVGLWGQYERIFPDEVTKAKLDDLHKRKIDLCDWVWVLDVGGYIGESTRSEIEYAARIGKPIRYLSSEYPNYTEPIDPLATATKERDEYKAALYIADSLGNGMFCESCSEDKTCAQCCLDRAKEQSDGQSNR